MVSSVSHTEAQAGMCAYASSKGGVVSLTLPLAREFSRFGQSCLPSSFECLRYLRGLVLWI